MKFLNSKKSINNLCLSGPWNIWQLNTMLGHRWRERLQVSGDGVDTVHQDWGSVRKDSHPDNTWQQRCLWTQLSSKSCKNQKCTPQEKVTNWYWWNIYILDFYKKGSRWSIHQYKWSDSYHDNFTKTFVNHVLLSTRRSILGSICPTKKGQRAKWKS